MERLTVTLDVVALEAVPDNVVGGSVLNETVDRPCSFLRASFFILSRDSSDKAIEVSLEAYNEKNSEE